MNDTLIIWYNWLPSLLGGFFLSCQVAAISVLIGIPLGLAFALGTGSSNKPVRVLSLILVEIGRGGPVLILLQFLYNGLPTAGITLTSLMASIVALTWSTGAYTSEIIRAGLNAVPAGQKEAAKTIGLSQWDTLRIVILPQALRISLPPLLGFSLLILQATSLCFTIALPEVVSVASDIGSATFEYMSVLTLTGLLFAAVCVPATFLVGRLERYVARHE